MPEQIPDETTQFTKQHDTPFLGISVRGLVVLIIVGTVCVMSVMHQTVDGTLQSICLSAMSFYFGQSIRPIGGPLK